MIEIPKRWAPNAWLLCVTLILPQLCACTITHTGPQEGTETGNPPVIDVTRVMLVLRFSELKISGSAGAVSPGGSIVNLRSYNTGATESVRSQPDGSFQFELTATRDDTYELRPADESGDTSRTAPVYVARGSAAASAQGLSCMQRSGFASMEVAGAAADTSCQRDSDCRWQATTTVCSDACADIPVSALGAQQIEEARSAAASGVCKNFAQDGCSVLALPCVPPAELTLRCLDNVCVGERPTGADSDSPGCSEAFDPGMGFADIMSYWYSVEAGACLQRRYGGIGGNANRYDTRAACEAACKPPTSSCVAPRISANVCLQEGPTGGCALMGEACALPCTARTPPVTSAPECAADPIGSFCFNGFCDATSPR